MNPRNHSTAHLLLQGNPNPRTIFKTRLSRQNSFSLAKSLGRDEMLQDGSLPQGGSQQCREQERLAFSFHLQLPLDVGNNKRKGLNFQARKQSKGIFRAQDTKVTEDAVTPNLKSSTITERKPWHLNLTSFKLHKHENWNQYGIKLEMMQFRIKKSMPLCILQQLRLILGNNCKNVCIKTQMHNWSHIHVGINISYLSQYPTPKVNFFSQKNFN